MADGLAHEEKQARRRCTVPTNKNQILFSFVLSVKARKSNKIKTPSQDNVAAAAVMMKRVEARSVAEI